MSRDRTAANAVLVAIRAGIHDRNIYRSRILQLGQGPQGELTVGFHTLPDITRDQIILPKGLLERVERQTIRFAQLRDRLRAADGTSARLLLYGPPGTGKTLTAMYLSSQMRDRTVLLLAGPQLGLLRPACAMARLLQPATVVLEDVDLIAEERTQNGQCNAILYQLLNQMDGLHDDADVPLPVDHEPAGHSRAGARLAAGPHRPRRRSPAARCRRSPPPAPAVQPRAGRAGIVVGPIRHQTDGASAAFIRELMRRATLLAVDETNEAVVRDEHVAAALHDLAFDGSALTRSLLGARLSSWTDEAGQRESAKAAA